MIFYEFQVPGQWNEKQTASWCTANTPFLPSVKQKGEMTRELSGWIITGEKTEFAWFVAWELAWAETAEIYLKCNEFLYLRVCQESKWSNIFLMEHFSTGKVLCFENITFYGNILLSAILLMQHGTLSMPDLASFFIPASAQEAGAALWLWGLPRVNNFRSDRLKNPNPCSTLLTFRSCWT